MEGAVSETLPREWATIDKGSWGPGPWQEEPDKVHWIDEATDLDCLMVRSPGGGNWCGYVAVTEGHPLFGVGYHDCPKVCVDSWCDHSPEATIRVHGGLTYSDFCAESDDPSRFICHVPLPGRPDRVWWFGFDCAHLHDIAPAHEARSRERGWPSFKGPGDRYRDRAYVEAEVRDLARQLKEIV